MFNGYLKYMWIGLYISTIVMSYIQLGKAGIQVSIFLLSIVSILLALLYYQEKKQEKEYEEKPVEEDKYTMGNFAFDVKVFVEMFNSSKTVMDFKKAKAFLDLILEKQEKLPSFNRFFYGYLWGNRQQMLYLQQMMNNYLLAAPLKLSDLTRINVFVREYRETVIGFGLNSFDTEYHHEMRMKLKGLKGYQRLNKIRLLNAQRAYQKKLGR